MFLQFPSIGPFRHVIEAVSTQHCSSHGPHQPLPTLLFQGTVKLHGANAAIIRWPDGRLQFQSRNRIVTPEDEHLGFSRHFLKTVGERALLSWMDECLGKQFPEVAHLPVAIYGEWCGLGIQHSVAISQLPPSFVIFAVSLGEPQSHQWLDLQMTTTLAWPEHRIFHIAEFPHFSLEIDFAHPEQSVEALQDIADQVEQLCPVAAALGLEGPGEGVVWRCQTSGFTYPPFWFKVKGQHFSGTKVRNRIGTKAERMGSAEQFLDVALAEDRLMQGIEFLEEQGIPLSKKSRREFVEWVSEDLLREESDTLYASGLSFNDVRPKIATRARQWFSHYLQQSQHRG